MRKKKRRWWGLTKPKKYKKRILSLESALEEREKKIWEYEKKAKEAEKKGLAPKEKEELEKLREEKKQLREKLNKEIIRMREHLPVKEGKLEKLRESLKTLETKMGERDKIDEIFQELIDLDEKEKEEYAKDLKERIEKEESKLSWTDETLPEEKKKKKKVKT